MSSASVEQHHKLLHLTTTTTKTTPPRKNQLLLLLLLRPSTHPLQIPHYSSFSSISPQTLGTGDDPDDNDGDNAGDPYSSDHFRMFEFKVRQCTRTRSHDWTDCPFSHPGEKARRRDPRRYDFYGTMCPEYRRTGGICSSEDECEYAHGVFEAWLHPGRYRTEPCKDCSNCKRKVCFFAHSPQQLRILTPPSPSSSSSSFSFQSNHSGLVSSRCRRFLRRSIISSSPTSTLTKIPNFTFNLSPPLSPENYQSATSRIYRDVLT